ncbi:MAG: nitroreductase family protein [Bacilli bacterium]
MDAIQAILSRQSIREYDPQVKIDEATLLKMLTEASSAPSSWNLQPWRFVVIQNPELKAKLRPYVLFNTPQLDTASALVLILNDLDRYALFPVMNKMELDAGFITEEHYKVRNQKAEQARATRSKESLDREGLLDCGLVAQNLMIVARAYGYDSCPMGGFDRDNFMKVLEIDTNRYKPVVLISIGKRAKDAKQTLRFPIHTITTIK